MKQKMPASFFKTNNGATKIYPVLRKENLSVSVKYVQQWRRQLNLHAITSRKYNTKSNKQAMISSINNLNQAIVKKEPKLSMHH